MKKSNGFYMKIEKLSSQYQNCKINRSKKRSGKTNDTARIVDSSYSTKH